MATVLNIEAILSDPAIHGGRPVIAGTHIRVADLVASHVYRGLSPEELAVNFKLDMGQVYAALAYYYMHKESLDNAMRDDADRAGELLSDLDQQGS